MWAINVWFKKETWIAARKNNIFCIKKYRVAMPWTYVDFPSFLSLMVECFLAVCMAFLHDKDSQDWPQMASTTFSNFRSEEKIVEASMWRRRDLHRLDLFWQNFSFVLHNLHFASVNLTEKPQNSFMNVYHEK